MKMQCSEPNRRHNPENTKFETCALRTLTLYTFGDLYRNKKSSFFCCCASFGNKNINVSTRFDQIHHLFHKILRINIILKSIKGHNSVETFRKIMCISHNIDHISMHEQNFIKIHSLFLKRHVLRKNESLTSIKGHNSVKKFGKIPCLSHNTACTKFHQNPSICSQDIKWKQNSDINQGPQLS